MCAQSRVPESIPRDLGRESFGVVDVVCGVRAVFGKADLHFLSMYSFVLGRTFESVCSSLPWLQTFYGPYEKPDQFGEDLRIQARLNIRRDYGANLHPNSQIPP